MQKDLGYEFCRTVSDKNPIVAGPLQAHRLLARVRRRRGGRAGRHRDRAGLKKAVVFRAAEQVNDFLPMSRSATSSPSRGRRWPGSGRWRRRALGLDDLDLVETHDCFTIAELIEYEAMGLTAQGRGRARDPRRLDRKGRAAAGQPVGRAQIEGPSDRRHRRVDARAGGDAGDRHRPAASRCRAPHSPGS